MNLFPGSSCGYAKPSGLLITVDANSESKHELSLEMNVNEKPFFCLQPKAMALDAISTESAADESDLRNDVYSLQRKIGEG